jgi:hypothetical protein
MFAFQGFQEDFQRRLKAQKDSDRKKQLDAQTLLQGYRGSVTGEDLKLKAMKEEERKKNLDAERLLHSYQKKEELDVKAPPKLKAPPKAKAAAAVVLDVGPETPPKVKPGPQRENDSLQNTESGPASAEAATYSSPRSVTGEDLKLKAMKQEKRKKNLDAEQLLHSYSPEY